MFLWDEALYAGRIIERKTLDRAFTPFKFNDGTEGGAACGWGVSQLRGHRALIHVGGMPGFWCYGLTMPEERVFVVILSNGPGRPPGPSNLAAQLAANALGEPYEAPHPVELSESLLGALAGKYQVESEHDQQELEIRLEGPRVILLGLGPKTMELLPLSETELYVKERFPTRILVVNYGRGGVHAGQAAGTSPDIHEDRTEERVDGTCPVRRAGRNWSIAWISAPCRAPHLLPLRLRHADIRSRARSASCRCPPDPVRRSRSHARQQGQLPAQVTSAAL
ncbi:MAG: hypothetical protein AB1714_20670 [Acidobacteriota bacterium]